LSKLFSIDQFGSVDFGRHVRLSLFDFDLRCNVDREFIVQEAHGSAKDYSWKFLPLGSHAVSRHEFRLFSASKTRSEVVSGSQGVSLIRAGNAIYRDAGRSRHICRLRSSRPARTHQNGANLYA
jgi:hypothetical protein